MKLVLASASPRRLDLLARIGVTPDAVDPADIDETVLAGELPRVHALRLAQEKAAATAARHPDALVLGADTVVAVGRRILPKVEDEATLRQCMTLLSGRRHLVLTGVALALPGGGMKSRVVETMIAMKRLSDRGSGLLRQSRRVARQGGRLCVAGLWRSLCPPHRQEAIPTSSACRLRKPATS